MKKTEYAAAEPGYEDQAEWVEDRQKAEGDVAYDKSAGLDSYLIERTVTVTKWRVSK